MYVLKPSRVFDEKQMHGGWQVIAQNNTIKFIGIINKAILNAKIIWWGRQLQQ